jgi:hypothetical protein
MIQSKKLGKKYLVKMVRSDLSKMAFWSSWTWGQKNHRGGFLLKFSVKKLGFLVLPFPCLNHIQVDGYSLDVFNCHDFIHINCYEGNILTNVIFVAFNITQCAWPLPCPNQSYYTNDFWKGFSPSTIVTSTLYSCD